MIVVGIDPGIAICGCALVEDVKGTLRLLHHVAITTSKDAILPDRLGELYTTLEQILVTWKPDVMAIESLFFNTNAKTALIVGQARGVVQLAAWQQKLPVTEYTPLQVKQSMTGYGRADKNQIQQMTMKILKLPTIIKPDDVADAVAIALTHCFSYKMTMNNIKLS